MASGASVATRGNRDAAAAIRKRAMGHGRRVNISINVEASQGGMGGAGGNIAGVVPDNAW